MYWGTPVKKKGKLICDQRGKKKLETKTGTCDFSLILPYLQLLPSMGKVFGHSSLYFLMRERGYMFSMENIWEFADDIKDQEILYFLLSLFLIHLKSH